MTQKTKRIALLVLLGALISLLLVAISLSSLQLQPGDPFPGANDQEPTLQTQSGAPSIKTYSFPMLKGILASAFLILTIFVVVRLFLFINLKQIRKFILPMILILGVLYFLPRIEPNQPQYVPIETLQVSAPPLENFEPTPLGKPPDELIWIVVIAIGLGVGGLGYYLFKQNLKQTSVEDQLLLDAEDAVRALQAGIDLRNVVLRCYLQMTRSLQEDQSIERSDHMTVREFEHLLEKKGFPLDPVAQLTGLYERVRYGKQKLNSADETLAVDSLNEIIRFCRGEKRAENEQT